MLTARAGVSQIPASPHRRKRKTLSRTAWDMATDYRSPHLSSTNDAALDRLAAEMARKIAAMTPEERRIALC